MDILARGLQTYLTVIGGILLLALVWVGNRYLTESTAAETGWPIMVAIAMLLVALIVVGRHLVEGSGKRLPLIGRESQERDWNSRR